MQVDFNNLRKKTADAFNDLIDQLNENDFFFIDDIKDEIEELRYCISAILCTYSEGDSNFKDLSDPM